MYMQTNPICKLTFYDHIPANGILVISVYMQTNPICKLTFYDQIPSQVTATNSLVPFVHAQTLREL